MLPCLVCHKPLALDFSCPSCSIPPANLPKPFPDPIREQLKEIDALEDAECNEFECSFLESIMSHQRPLTEKQLAVAERMIEKYLS